ncbi:sensor histidine kinase [Calothrix rhizosoleniae]|uniref:sensor histidine kinase n=1 Tax=Calothrix rhizosoleniae TaxID=888997 RepID=UPI000B49DFE5|nr:ATP-binding protein [Calothrix rhizosoleniae]
MYAPKSYSYQVWNDTLKDTNLTTDRRGEDVQLDDSEKAERFEVNTEAAQRILQLEYELRQTRENFKVFVEELIISAEVAKEAKKDFIGHMSHKLRTPLNGILGFTQILKRDPSLNSSQYHGIDIIHDCGTQLSFIINDLLHLSNIEAGKLQLQFSDFQFPVFLENLMAIPCASAEQKGISFDYQPQSCLPDIIRCDESRLQQVLLNLLSNAIKFTETGGVVFKVGYENQTIRFQIEDTGLGIPETHLSDIFLPFQQYIDSQLPNEGVGIGLTISQKIVQLLGGEIHVNSTVGQGTTFWFDLHLPEEKMPLQLNVNPHQIPANSKISLQDHKPDQDYYISIIPPPSQELNILLDLAMKGDIKAIIEQAHRLKQLDTQYLAFAREIIKFAESFQELKIIEFINNYH